MAPFKHARVYLAITPVFSSRGLITDVKTLAEVIRERRKKLDLSQAALAKLAHVSQSTIGNIEAQVRGHKGEPPPSLPKIAHALGTNTEELMREAGMSLAAALGVSEPTAAYQQLEPGGRPRTMRRVPVVGTARLGENGFYEELGHATGYGDGWVDGYSADPGAYALRVKGDSMHPAIRHGSFVVVEPHGTCVPGEYVVIALRDGRKMVKELVIERADEVVVESVNGNRRMTFEKAEIEKMHAVAAVVAASKWRPD